MDDQILMIDGMVPQRYEKLGRSANLQGVFCF